MQIVQLLYGSLGSLCLISEKDDIDILIPRGLEGILGQLKYTDYQTLT